ncbi:hypothetical protein HW555_006036 [Spodoptera exigua]|uniref:Uncharacterized protein n=1 Tax=Spodoptera exigua TaxID=7107 RepID=A0A835GJI4_SPOEX|nr:hypothetical protein HW555_006036 [Spodoptera exigua]
MYIQNEIKLMINPYHAYIRKTISSWTYDLPDIRKYDTASHNIRTLIRSRSCRARRCIAPARCARLDRDHFHSPPRPLETIIEPLTLAVIVASLFRLTVWSREESVAGSCVAGLIPGGRVPEERSRRGGAAVCRSVTALPARRALAAVSSCVAPRRAAIVPSSRQLLCLSATLYILQTERCIFPAALRKPYISSAPAEMREKG